MSANHWGGVARYGLPGLLAGLALAWWGGGGRGPTALAQGLGRPGEPNGTIAFTSTMASGSQMLYLIDTKAQAFAVYRYEPSGLKGAGTVKLEACRQYRYDLMLSEYNNAAPNVSDIEAMVSKPKK
jgi:hypothetical protein